MGDLMSSQWLDVASASTSATLQQECPMCGFALFTPIAKLRVSHAGLYDDARFPGRLIVSLDTHFEHFDQVDPVVLAQFMADLQTASVVLRKMGGVDRVNVAVLGNKDPHVHAHVIPRRLSDANFGVAPWEGAAPHCTLDPAVRVALIERLRQGFDEIGS
ncbi:HIT family protein [Mycolicibacterium sp.]|uniref:HIT family protein n=1 Tax=Mycolicibacterium sp. TaxID=2320850 RepID=UPI0037C664B5